MVLLVSAAIGAVPDAHAQRAFSRRFPAPAAQPLNVAGDIALIGNINLHCDAAAANCAEARAGGTFRNNNFTALVHVNVDPDGGANFNSSSATLDLPAGAQVLFAGLYWGGRNDAGLGTDSVVRVRSPGGGYATVNADVTDRVSGGYYQSFEDVTALVTASGNGVYTVANVATRDATADRWAGWTLVVAYRHDAEPMRNLSVFDGFQQGNATNTQIDIAISGIYTPPAGPVDTKIGLVLYDGDRGVVDDSSGTGLASLQFGPDASTLSDVTDPVNPVTDFWNSTISDQGANVTAGRTPAYSNTLGLDIDLVKPSVPLPNSASTAHVRTRASGGDVHFPGMISLATQVFSPEIVTNFSKTAADANGGQFRPGDTVVYEMSVSNTGNDHSTNTVISDPLPAGVSYVAGSLRILSGPNMGPKTDASGDDQAEYQAGSRTVVFRVGDGANAVTGGQLAPVSASGPTTAVRFLVTIDASQAAGSSLSNIGRIDYTSQTSGQPGSGTTPPSSLSIAGNADLSVAKTLLTPGPHLPGSILRYAIGVSNAGPDPAGVTVTDTLPAGTTFVSFAPSVGWSASTPPVGGTGTVTAAIPDFASGASTSFTLEVMIDPAVAPGTVITNTASVSSDRDDPNPTDNAASAQATVSTGADLSLAKSLLTAGPYHEGQAVQYRIEVANAGPLTATGVQVTDTPSNLTITGVSGGGCAALPCTIASIAAGASVSLDVTATIDAAGAFDNAASASANEADPNPGDTTDGTGNGGIAQPAADLSLTKTITSATPAMAGSTVTYAIAVRNLGPAVVTGATLVDTVPPQLSGVSWTCVPAPACGVPSGVGDINLGLTLAPGEVATVTVSGVAPAATPATIAANTATVAPPAGTVDPTPGNDASTTPPIIVDAKPIGATGDAGVIGGAAGGTAIADVLGNDTLDGAGATPGTVEITQVTPAGSGNVTLDTTTGAVNVAAGTPAGTYTIDYRICERLNPGNCATATATVTVTAAAIVALDDAGSIDGSTGGAAIADVFGNDTLDGAPVAIADVIAGLLASSHANVTFDPATGRVDVAAGTPAGTYALDYRICERLNPANCDDATATVTVTAAPIVANDDSAGPVPGRAGTANVVDVLGNDTLGGMPASAASVALAQVSTAHANVALDVSTGMVGVAPATPAGTYAVGYRVCERLNPANCATAVASVTVGAAVLVADPDTGSAGGAAGGTAIASVLGNDRVDGAAATTADVALVQLATTHANVALDPASGAVNVAPGTPAGTYTVDYRICERLNPAHCTTATAQVQVTAAAIDAIDDATPAVEGGVGAANVADVLGNDTLGGGAATLANVTLVQLSTTHANVALDPATGAVNVAPGTPAGVYLVAYRLCEQLNPTNCDTGSVTVNVVAPSLGAVDDAGATSQNIAVVIAVLANDTLAGTAIDPARALVTVTAGPANGTVAVDDDGSVAYTPASNYSGPDTFTYQVCDRINPTVCTSAAVTVTVAPNAIEAIDQAVTTPQTGPVLIDPMATTRNGGGAPLDPGSVRIVAPPASGTVTVHANGSMTYTPNRLFFGSETFAYRICDTSQPAPVCDVATVTVNVAMQAPQLRVSKTTPARAVRAGDFVRYTVVVENTGIAPANATTLVDVPPAGFSYVEGSLSVDDADDRADVTGTGLLRIAGVDVPVGGRATVAYLLRVGAGVGHGTHVNRVSATDAGGATVSNGASADVRVEGDPLIEDSLILGSVFEDRDGDGVQDDDEPGVLGVRIASVEGLLIETDLHGRYHLAGIGADNALRGRNFILKVDASTLPPGTAFTTANPLVRRITPGIPVRFDFGVTLPQGGDTGNATR